MDHTKKAYHPWCIACDTFLRNKKGALVAHSKYAKHTAALENLLSKHTQQKQLANFVNDPVRNQVVTLETRMCLLMAQKNLSMNVGHECLEAVRSVIQGNHILNQATLGRTKAANLIREGKNQRMLSH